MSLPLEEIASIEGAVIAGVRLEAARMALRDLDTIDRS